jgi:type IV secretion system protein VirB10
MNDTTKRDIIPDATTLGETTQRDQFPPQFETSESGRLAAPAPVDATPEPELQPDDHLHLFDDAHEPEALDPPPLDIPDGADVSGEPTRSNPTASEMTFASRLPPDHPGLQLEQPQARTLRKGPVILASSLLAVAVAVAAFIALSPKSHDAQAATPALPEGASKNVAIPDTVANAQGNDADLHPPPKLGPPLGGADPEKTPPAKAGGGSSLGRQAQRELARVELAKLHSSPILAELEAPQQEQGLPAAAAAAAGMVGAAMNGAAPKADQPPVPAAGAAGGADANLQQHKADFISRDGANNATYLSQPVLMPRSPFEVKAGTIIPTTLLTGINSDLPGQIVGQVRENVYDTVSGAYLLIPQGSRLIAAYDSAVSFGQERVLVCWNRLIRTDGVSISLECMPGVDLAGSSGFSDEVNHHWWRIVTGVALGTLLSATADRAAGNVTGYSPTVPQLWAANAGGAVNQAATQITQKNLAIQPTITIRPGYSVNVLVSKDIVIQPYASQGASR